MILTGAIINMIAVIIGGLIGTFSGNAISEKMSSSIIVAIGLMTLVMGVKFAIQTTDILLVLICLILGTIIGTWLDLAEKMDHAAEAVGKRMAAMNLARGRFTEAFISTTILFCVGTMTVVGSIKSGLEHDHSILITKSIMDMVSAVVFASALGGGVLLSAVSVLVIEGGIAMIASLAAPVLTTEVVGEMSAVGGAIFIGLALNLIGVTQQKIKVENMLPAIILPIICIPLLNWIYGLF